MAIFKSSVFSEVRGSIGGTTYARNKSGLYARNRSKPVNPNTGNQSLVRSRLGTLAALFSTLSVAQVAAWNQFAQGYPAVNKVGDTYTPNGRQVFMLCNLNLASIGVDPILIPPYDTPIVPDLSINEVVMACTLPDGGGAIATLTVTGLSSSLDTAVIMVQLSPPQQPARQSYRNRMRQITFNDDFGAPVNVLPEYNAYFGTPHALNGQIINARASATDPASGVASAWFYFSTVATDAGP